MTGVALGGAFVLVLLVLAARRRVRAHALADEAPRVYDTDAPCFSRDPITGARDRMGF